MTSVRTWERCVDEIKRRKKTKSIFTFLSEKDLRNIQTCYCTLKSAKKSTHKTKKNVSKSK